MDRIDLYANVSDVEHSKLITHNASANEDTDMQKRVLRARTIQKDRYQTSTLLNSSMSNKHIKQFADLQPEAKILLDTAAERLNISARSYMRTIKIARTIADLDNSKQIHIEHLSEALQYRQPARTI